MTLTTPPTESLLWTTAYIALSTTLIVAGGIILLYGLGTGFIGHGPAVILFSIMLVVVAASPAIAQQILQFLYHRTHHTTLTTSHHR